MAHNHDPSDFSFPSSSSSPPKPSSSRIHFPASTAEDAAASRSRRVTYGSPLHRGTGTGFSSGTDFSQQQQQQQQPVQQGRHRIRSLDMSGALNNPSSSSGAGTSVGASAAAAGASPRNRRTVAKSLVGPPLTERIGEEEEEDGSGSNNNNRLFSDEYDLDPRILQDVERALKSKAKRDARLKSGIGIAASTIPKTREHDFTFPTSAAASNGPRLAHQSSLRGLNGQPVKAEEADFSPAVISPFPPHPIPISSDGGKTLCWGGLNDEETNDSHARKWTLSTSKRKGKEKEHDTFDAKIIAELDLQYKDKLRRISTLATPQTLNKANITATELSSRYQRLYASVSSEPAERVNLAAIARWYGELSLRNRQSFEQYNPFTWLKHLEKRKPANYMRPHWHLSDAVVDRYYRDIEAQKRFGRGSGTLNLFEPRFVATAAAYQQQSLLGSPFSSASRGREGEGDRRKLSFDLPGENPPLPPFHTETSPRKSIDAVSTYSSLPSAPPSIHSGKGIGGAHTHTSSSSNSHPPPTHPLNQSRSPASSRIQLGERIPAFRRRQSQQQRHYQQQRDGESDGGSSARGVGSGGGGEMSEGGRSDDGLASLGLGHPSSSPVFSPSRGGKTSRQIRIDIPDQTSSATIASAGGNTGIRIVISRENSDAELSSPIRLRSGLTAAERSTKLKNRLISLNSSSVTSSGGNGRNGRSPVDPMTDSASLFNGRRNAHRMSFPASINGGSFPPPLTEEQIREQEENEEKLAKVYKAKMALLHDCTAQNNRMRQLLKGIGEVLKEYTLAQQRVTKLSGLTLPTLPQEVIEAIKHDPAGIIGLRQANISWRTIDSIQVRLFKQREVLEAFIRDTRRREGGIMGMPDKSVLSEPIERLLDYLEVLEEQKEAVVMKARRLGEQIEGVKEMHKVVKKEYNDAQAHTSVVYPELSLLVGLEENYRAQYQHFWDLGMDILTLILDTVTPFWRTYGKTIGEDIRDFLIIPLYRNEFTGESQRYPISSFPRRSLRHWACLLLLFAGCIGVCMVQGYVAWMSTVNVMLGEWIQHSGLRWVLWPFWVGSVIMQWMAVIVEVFVVFCQVGMAVWWMGWFVDLCR